MVIPLIFYKIFATCVEKSTYKLSFVCFRKSTTSAAVFRMRLEELLQRQENSKCADCFEPAPTWASTNWGVFLCTQCAGVHRSVDPPLRPWPVLCNSFVHAVLR